ncbi:MAG: hypothetical protein KY468_02690, partial [Armatimonadetes bacterium]|nr:hypothetical protein [Armatimonadota bacterium]
ERHGYDVSYISNLDTHLDPEGLRCAKGFLSVGHDEYWTREMFENVKAAIADGLSAAFLSGNSIGFPVNLHPCDGGTPNRVLERLPGWERTMPESAAVVMGARNVSPVTGVGDWTVRRADHWVFEGTGMRDGDSIPGLVGWEYHDGPGDQTGLEVLAEGKTINHVLKEGHYAATIYPGPKGNWVFNAATIWWSQGLSSPPGHLPAQAFGGHTQGPDERVQRITANFLNRIGSEHHR